MSREDGIPAFGDLLRQYRRATGLTQEALAERAGLSVRGINDLERGARRTPRRDTVVLLASALGLAGDDHTAFLAACAKRAAAPRARAPAHIPLPIGAFLGALPEGPLVDRETEIERCSAALDATVSGTGRLVLISGEPGIGKTRLAQEVALAARNRGFLVATGRCYEPQATVAYYPFLEALHLAYAQASAPLQAQLPREWAEAARLIPDLNAGVDPPEESRAHRSGEDQQRLFWHVARFVESLAERQPVALLLDDLQWADSASLALLQHLARQNRAAPVLLLGTYRDLEVQTQHPLAAALHDLVREHLVERISLRRLSAAGTSALVQATMGEGGVSEEFADLVHARAAGNPFFTREILLAWVERGDVYRTEGGDWNWRKIEAIALPESVRSVIGHRLALLDIGTRDILREASVFGQTFAFDELHGVSSQPEPALEQALEQAANAGLVREATSDTYTFHHALIQNVLYAEVPMHRRRRLHRAAGEVIEHLPERQRVRRTADLAWHFLQSDDAMRALRYALLAGDHAEAVYAHTEAERHYTAALDLARELEDGPREAEAQEKLGAALFAQSYYDDALEQLEQAYARYDAMGDVEGCGRAVTHIGWTLAERGTPEQGIARLRAEFARVCPLSPGTLAQLHFTLAHLWFVNGHYVECAESAAEAARQAGIARDERLELRALTRQATAISKAGATAGSVNLCTRIIARAETLHDDWSLARAHGNMYADLAHMGMPEEARAHMERWVAACEHLGSPTELALALDEQAAMYYFQGDWARCRAGMERAAHLLRHIPVTWRLPYLHLDIGIMDLYQGRTKDAREHFRQARAIAEPGSVLQLLRALAAIESEADLLELRPAAARERLESLLDRPGEEAYDVTVFLYELAWAYCELGDVPHADSLVDEGIARAERGQVAAPLIDLWRIQGLIRMRQQRWYEAASALDASLKSSRKHPHVHAEVKTLYIYGQLHAELGESEQARNYWEQALAICRRLDERFYAERIEQALAES